MNKLIMFTTEKELSQLTGLNHDLLWENGFDLDDWDVGFRSETELNHHNCWLLRQMENYCCGYEETVYDDKHYYLVYHA